jgi:hypothetical protein
MNENEYNILWDLHTDACLMLHDTEDVRWETIAIVFEDMMDAL